MTGAVPKPWHAEALRLHADGLAKTEIARRLGMCRNAVSAVLNPDYGQRRRTQTNARRKRRYATNEALRASYRTPEYRVRRKLYLARQIAREEAAATGADVEAVYQKWGCELPRLASVRCKDPRPASSTSNLTE